MHINRKKKLRRENIIKLFDQYGILYLNSKKYPSSEIIFDLEDLPIIQHTNWYVHHGYVLSTHEKVGLHRYVTNAPKGLVVDHLDHNTFNNRKKNLRLCTSRSNTQNNACNTSGTVGVYLNKMTNRYYVQAIIKGDRISRNFDSKEQAINFRRNLEQDNYNTTLYEREKENASKNNET